MRLGEQSVWALPPTGPRSPPFCSVQRRSRLDVTVRGHQVQANASHAAMLAASVPSASAPPPAYPSISHPDQDRRPPSAPAPDLGHVGSPESTGRDLGGSPPSLAAPGGYSPNPGSFTQPPHPAPSSSQPAMPAPPLQPPSHATGAETHHTPDKAVGITFCFLNHDW